MNLPQPFIDQIKPILGNETEEFLQVLQTNSPTSIRVNNKIEIEESAPKSSKGDFDSAIFGKSPLGDLGAGCVSWCDTGFYLSERPLFTADPLFHAGAYYVQEASSMFVEQAVKQYIESPVTMLDLCAAPGGKSTHLSSLLPEGSLLVSNEIIRSRAYILSENMIKWGNANVVVTNNEPKDFEPLHSFFDAMLVDAPCSGEGMFRKDEGAIKEWSLDNVRKCVERQRDILTKTWSALKPGGILIYSTCTYNRQENEENIRFIINELGADLLPINIKTEWGIVESDFGYRFYPHKVQGEGFFMSVLRKTSGEKTSFNIKKEKKNTKKLLQTDFFGNYLQYPENWEISQKENIITALPIAQIDEIEFLKKRLKTFHCGISLAEQKGKDFIPDISLALSKNINLKNFNVLDVDLETAVLYLQKEAVAIPQAEKGYVLLTYKNIPFGWVKNLGNRANNLYPSEWRIRMKIK